MNRVFGKKDILIRVRITKPIMKIALIITVLLTITLFSCHSTANIAYDPLYFEPGRKDTIVILRKSRWIGGIGEPFPTPYYYPMGGWWGTGYANGYRYEWYRPKDIIVVTPKTVGPRSGGNAVPNRRRGRN
jgi:hypothetical protein